MEILTLIIGSLGILVMFSSLLIMKYSDKNEKRIFRDHNDLPNEEFAKLRRRYVYLPQEWAFYLILIGNLLMIPCALYFISQGTWLMGIILLGVVIYNIIKIIITKR